MAKSNKANRHTVCEGFAGTAHIVPVFRRSSRPSAANRKHGSRIMEFFANLLIRVISFADRAHDHGTAKQSARNRPQGFASASDFTDAALGASPTAVVPCRVRYKINGVISKGNFSC